ncbi:MAG: hypothetical protein PHP73_04995 [Candidatus Omnitrophica bacterium]|nr:hypothetical protein [Candidatus Omnitrophota bacterium]
MRKTGQSINEYVLVIVLVTLAGIGMQNYIKRGIQGIVKTSADTLAGEKGDTVVYSGSDKSILTRYDQAGNLQWNPVAVSYESRLSGGFFVAEKTGNQVQYIHYPDTSDLNNKIIIGGQDQASGDFTSYDWEGYVDAVYDKDGKLIKKFTPQEARDNYSKYDIVLLSSAAAKSMVQNGVVERGLIEFGYKDPLKPLTFNTPTPRKITVKTYSKYSGPKSLALADWHPAMTAYKEKMEEDKIGGFIQTEIKGSMVYYYTFTTNPKDRVLIGGEDTRTGDFTGFDPDGFPVSTVDGKLNVLRTYSGYLTDPETEEIVGVTGSDGKIYGQHQIVTISPALQTTGPATVAIPMRTKTIDNDTTQVTGAWEATYKLGTDIYKPKGNTPPIKK